MSACMHACTVHVCVNACVCMSVCLSLCLCVCLGCLRLIIIIHVNSTNKTGCDVYLNYHISVSEQGVMMLLFSYDMNTC